MELICPSCDNNLEDVDISTESSIVRSMEFTANLVCPFCGVSLKHTGFIIFLEDNREGVEIHG